ERVLDVPLYSCVVAQHHDLASRFGERTRNPSSMDARHGEDETSSIDEILGQPTAAMRGNIQAQPPHRCARAICRWETITGAKSRGFCPDI
ncbi:MAG TPA: hypothetical protein VJ714_07580, partial [Anaerolineae bacterium]|nr:hypothetical protein [Anaerolineae bacterium]